ncbi:MAG: nucleotidyltransferase domain-containing protein [Candidatus Rokubacteria bacterium]|nr:nucleotidyltransferase domain-containing protein [Candidatus Rokubacteria bacterium]
MNELPDPVAELCASLGRIDGVEAVTIGGSRAAGMADETSDWDVGVYYRGGIDLAPLARYGEVHPPGSWGRIMNGGAWLSLEGTKVDVLLRDLDVALYWSGQARLGTYEVDALLGYLAGAPTYSLMAELALNRTVQGHLPAVGEYPKALSEAGARRWPLHCDFSLTHARTRAGRGDIVGAVGQAAKAVIEMAHALACRRRLWVLNEKKLVEQAGLEDLHACFVDVPASSSRLVAWVDGLHAAVGRARS